MVNKKKTIQILGALALFILASLGLFLTGGNLISLVEMDEKITFSSNVFIIFFSFPLISYTTFLIIFLL
ncbi:hypothetical protein [Photorhabdus akhurstii]|uniref:hypothetical protein n=1 Tax=Photorhabdus akhurstii TaxID=171438 RepID=UPI00300D803A